MFAHLSKEHYEQFKSTYRISEFRNNPCKSIDKIVALAYLDVNRTLRGIREHKEQSSQFKNLAVNFLRKIIQDPPNTQECFDNLHSHICRDAVQICGGAEIHYGQAQKLLNMSAKYLYNEFVYYSLKNPRKNFLGYPRHSKIEHFFHLPVDRLNLVYLNKYHKLCSSLDVVWSRWDQNKYLEFKEKLRRALINDYYPLEIDYLIWGSKNCVTRGIFRSGCQE